MVLPKDKLVYDIMDKSQCRSGVWALGLGYFTCFALRLVGLEALCIALPP